MTTYTEFVTNLSSLVVAGVSRRYAYPPPSVENLPCSFPLLPGGEESPLTFQANGANVALHCQLVIAYKAVAQGRPEDDFTGTLALMDALASALRAAVGTVCKGKLTWAVRVGEARLGDVPYWAVIADVSGQSF